MKVWWLVVAGLGGCATVAPVPGDPCAYAASRDPAVRELRIKSLGSTNGYDQSAGPLAKAGNAAVVECRKRAGQVKQGGGVQPYDTPGTLF